MKKATSLMKQIVALLSSMAKAKSIAIKNKTSEFKTRILMLSLVKHKKLGFRSISNKIHNLLGHADHDHDHDQDNSKAIVLYNAASTMEAYDVLEEDNDKYPDLRHSLFEEEDFDEFEEGQGSSVIDMVSTIQSCSQGINKVVETLQQKFPDVPKTKLRQKVREISDFEDHHWQVKQEVLTKLGLSPSPDKGPKRPIKGGKTPIKTISTFFSKRCLPP